MSAFTPTFFKKLLKSTDFSLLCNAQGGGNNLGKYRLISKPEDTSVVPVTAFLKGVHCSQHLEIAFCLSQSSEVAQA